LTARAQLLRFTIGIFFATLAPGTLAVTEAHTIKYLVTFQTLWALTALLALSAGNTLVSVRPQLNSLHRMQRAQQSP